MAVPIGIREVENVLRPWLGTLFLSSSGLCEGAAGVLKDYAPYRETLYQVHDRLDSYLFVTVNRLTNGSMRVVMDDYHTTRLSLQDMSWMTDDLMGVLFDTLTPFSANFERLNDYALHCESLAALRVLYQKYRSFFSEEEFCFMVAMIKKIHPAQRYCGWLRG